MTCAILTLRVPVSKEKTDSDCRNLFVRNKSFLFHMDGSSIALAVLSPKSVAGHQEKVMDYSSKCSSSASAEGKKKKTQQMTALFFPKSVFLWIRDGPELTGTQSRLY